MTRRASGPVAVAASVAVLLAGCGSASSGGTAPTAAASSAAGQLRQAANALASVPNLTATITVSATPASVVAFGRQYGGTLSSQQATALAGARLTLTRSSGGAGLSLASGSSTYLSLRSVDHTIYLQADLADAFALAGRADTYRSLRAKATQAADFVRQLFAGGWVSLSTSDIAGFLGAGAHSGTTTALLRGLGTLLTDDATITETGTGRVRHFKAAVDAGRLAHESVDFLTSLVPPFGYFFNSQADSASGRQLTLDATTTGGVLSQLSVNVGQLARHAASGPPVVTATFVQHASTITAPSGATPVDVSKLTQLIGSLGGGL